MLRDDPNNDCAGDLGKDYCRQPSSQGLSSSDPGNEVVLSNDKQFYQGRVAKCDRLSFPRERIERT